MVFWFEASVVESFPKTAKKPSFDRNNNVSYLNAHCCRFFPILLYQDEHNNFGNKKFLPLDSFLIDSTCVPGKKWINLNFNWIVRSFKVAEFRLSYAHLTCKSNIWLWMDLFKCLAIHTLSHREVMFIFMRYLYVNAMQIFYLR